ncbi:MAG: response regulator [Kiritimatiellae bacterium]|nr:response regulator [Kiritimatiellia bacterium]
MNKKKILLIEDEPCQIMMVKFRLEANDFDFISAPDGERGLQKAFNEKPDLILLDIVMPKMNGYEVCRRLRRNPATRDIPVILFTASAGNDIIQKCPACGADDYIIKPFESADLVAKIKAWLKEREKRGFKK